MLEMKTTCEKCKGTLSPLKAVYICSYECTYCDECATSLTYICPNCNGQLVARPRRPDNDE